MKRELECKLYTKELTVFEKLDTGEIEEILNISGYIKYIKGNIKDSLKHAFKWVKSLEYKEVHGKDARINLLYSTVKQHDIEFFKRACTVHEIEGELVLQFSASEHRPYSLLVCDKKALVFPFKLEDDVTKKSAVTAILRHLVDSVFNSGTSIDYIVKVVDIYNSLIEILYPEYNY